MKHHNTTIGMALATLALFVTLSIEAHAQDIVAVVPMNPDAQARALDREAARVLKPTSLIVLQDQSLEVALQQRRAPQPTAQLLESLANATLNISQGVERFFYTTPDVAAPLLQPAFDISRHNPEVLAFRNDLADQVWQAGIVLIRMASEASKDQTDALNLAVRLIALMPSRATDPKIVPPDVRPILADARAKLGESKTTLRLEVLDPECTLFLNGIQTSPDEVVVVDPAANYYAHADCSMLTSPTVWQVRLVPKQENVMLVPAVDPHRPPATGTHPARERAIAEWNLRATTELAGASIGVGVSAIPGTEEVVLARYDRAAGRVTWSDNNFAESVRRGLPMIFPEYSHLFGDAVEKPVPVVVARPPKPVDWVGVAFIGGGVISGGVGTYFVLAAKRQKHLLDCAFNNPTPAPDAECSDVPFGTAFHDFNRELRVVGSAQAVGWTLLGVGALSIGYGVYRVVRPARKRPQALHFEFQGTDMVFTW